MSMSCSAVCKLFLSVAIVSLVACGGSDGGDDDDPETRSDPTGYFVDSGVYGLTYTSPSHSGTTDINGGFLFAPGETTTFSYAGLTIGSIRTSSQTGVVTPLDLFGTTDVNNQSVRNTLVLLQSMDTDQDAGNGIILADTTSPARTNALAALNIGNSSFQTDLFNVVQPGGDGGFTVPALVPEADALDHFNDTLLAVEATPPLAGRWVQREGRFGDVSGVYHFEAGGNLTVIEADGCPNNDLVWSSTETQATRNCGSGEISFTWELTGNRLVMTGAGLRDTCTILTSRSYSIEASCIFQGSGLGAELVRFQRDMNGLNLAAVNPNYTHFSGGTFSYTAYTFSTDLTGTYHFIDERGLVSLEDTGTFDWAIDSTQISFSGTDGASLAFSDILEIGVSIKGAWINGADVYIPDFNGRLVSGAFWAYGPTYSIYDPATGYCKAIYAFNFDFVQAPDVMNEFPPPGSNIAQCDTGAALLSPDPDFPENADYTVTYRGGAVIFTNSMDIDDRKICWPVDLFLTTESGSAATVACSVNGGAFEFEVWRSL